MTFEMFPRLKAVKWSYLIIVQGHCPCGITFVSHNLASVESAEKNVVCAGYNHRCTWLDNQYSFSVVWEDSMRPIEEGPLTNEEFTILREDAQRQTRYVCRTYLMQSGIGKPAVCEYYVNPNDARALRAFHEEGFFPLQGEPGVCAGQ